jgi:hypothetical protein
MAKKQQITVDFHREIQTESGEWIEQTGEATGIFWPGHGGSWEEPPESDEVVDLVVTLDGIDVTDTLTEKELDHVIQSMIDTAYEEDFYE